MLEVTVVRCTGLKNTEFLTTQDPYVCVRYGDAKFTTETHTDGGRNPTFQETFVITDLLEGCQEIIVEVWNSNTFTPDYHIGSGRIPLSKVLQEGYQAQSWPLHCKRGRSAGEIRLILHYEKLNRHPQHQATPDPSHPPPPPPQPHSACYAQPSPSPCPPPALYPYHPPPPMYPPPCYHHQPAVYPMPPYPPPTYPPAPYPGQYPGAYPPY